MIELRGRSVRQNPGSGGHYPFFGVHYSAFGVTAFCDETQQKTPGLDSGVNALRGRFGPPNLIPGWALLHFWRDIFQLQIAKKRKDWIPEGTHYVGFLDDNILFQGGRYSTFGVTCSCCQTQKRRQDWIPE